MYWDSENQERSLLVSGLLVDGEKDLEFNWKGIEAADELFNICKENTSSNYFNPALNAYIKLVSNPAITGENRLLKLRKAMEIAKTDHRVFQNYL